MAKQNHIWWAPVVHVLGHLVGGTFIFFMLCAASVGLSLIMHSIQVNFEMPTFTIQVLTGLEHTILVVDSVLFVVFLAVTATRAFREMLK